MALLDTASDSELDVRKTVSNSLVKLGCQHTCLVLSSIRAFLDNTQTTPKVLWPFFIFFNFYRYL